MYGQLQGEIDVLQEECWGHIEVRTQKIGMFNGFSFVK